MPEHIMNKCAVLSDVSSQYAEVKKERNNLVGLLQNAIQTNSSTRERLQQQANETEILLTATQKSDAELAAIRAELAQISSQRDNKRRELCKAAEDVATQNEQREAMKNNLKSFELTLNGIELSNKSLEKACQRHSIMRKERRGFAKKKVMLLCYRRNSCSTIITKDWEFKTEYQDVLGLTKDKEREKYLSLGLASAEGHLRGLNMELQTSRKYLKQVRQMVDLLRLQIPKKVQMEGIRRGLIQELVGINARKAQISAWFEDPDREGHLRMLGGVDPSQSELWIILGQLERRLAAKEEDLVEKKLIYEAIGRLVDALKATTDANK
ncbi:hypothetical protein ACTXT7_003362 [Hymenolepis weldensis]